MDLYLFNLFMETEQGRERERAARRAGARERERGKNIELFYY